MQSKKPGKLSSFIRNSLLNWLGVPFDLTDEKIWREISGSQNYSGQRVTHNTVLTLSAAWACTRLISETISTLPLKLYERTRTGRVEARNHALYDVLHLMPNSKTTASVHWEANTAAMLLRGQGCSEKIMFNGRLVGLKFLSPARLSERCIRGKRTFYYTEADGRKREIPSERIFRIPGFSLDGDNGVSVIEYGVNVFGNALAADMSAGKTFANGMQPTTYFKIDRTLKKEQREEFEKNTKERIKGAMNAGNSPLLEGGMDIGIVKVSPKDAQLIETRGLGVEEICRFFRVPPWMVGHSVRGQTRWGTGLEQEMIAFLTFTLRPWLTRIEQGISKDLLTPQERLRYYAEFDVRALLRADSAARAAFYSVMVDHGIMTRDEVRRAENYEAKGGNAEVLTVQSAMIPLDGMGSQEE